MNEFFPPKREADATKQKIEKIEGEVNNLEKLTNIGARLIKEGLKDKDDELEDHLVPQLERIMESQNIPNIAIAEDLVVLGYEIDTALDQGIGIGETLLGSIEELTQMVKALLQDEFPNIGEAEVTIVIGKVIDNHDSGFFVDTLLTEIEKRREVMRGLKGSKYKTDDSTGVVEQIVPNK